LFFERDLSVISVALMITEVGVRKMEIDVESVLTSRGCLSSNGSRNLSGDVYYLSTHRIRRFTAFSTSSGETGEHKK
jgi:hypothetical protein